MEIERMPNEVGGLETALPEEVSDKMKKLLSVYNSKKKRIWKTS